MYNSVQCERYSVQPTVFGIPKQYTLYRIQLRVYIKFISCIQYKGYSVHCEVYSIQHTVQAVECKLYSLNCTVYSAQYKLSV